MVLSIFRSNIFKPNPYHTQTFEIKHGVEKSVHMVVHGNKNDDGSCTGKTYQHKVGTDTTSLNYQVVIEFYTVLGKLL